MTVANVTNRTLHLYRALLKAVRFYPSKKRDGIAAEIKAEFREKKGVSGEQLEKALWLGEMELKRLQTWVSTGKQMMEGKDMDIKL